MQGKLAEAIVAYKRVIQLRPDMADAYVNLGRAYGLAGRLDEAIAEYQKALTRDATLVYAHYGIGLAYRHKGMFPEAIVALEKAITRQPDFVEALMQLGYIYRETDTVHPRRRSLYHGYANLSKKTPRRTMNSVSAIQKQRRIQKLSRLLKERCN